MCDVAYALLVEQYEGDGRAAMALGEERPPQAFRNMVDEALTEASAASTGRYVSPDERELRDALGVG